jgi:hypothetical protein
MGPCQRARAIRQGAEAGAGRGKGAAGRLVSRPLGRFGKEAAQGGLRQTRREVGVGSRPVIGFGILVTRQIVDEMHYSERGNEALRIKRLA